jgi:hypothetical protein
MATDLLHALQGRGLEFPPSEAAWDRVVERATVRRRNRRLGSALIAIVLFVASDTALLGFLHGRARLVPGGELVTPASGPAVPLTGSGSSASSTDDMSPRFGGAGGPLRNDSGLPTRTHHPTSTSTPAGGEAGSGHHPGIGPTTPDGREPPGRHQPGGCGSHRFHVRCRPPSVKWRTPSSRGQLGQMPSFRSVHGSVSLHVAAPPASVSSPVSPLAERRLRTRITPRRAGPVLAG